MSVHNVFDLFPVPEIMSLIRPCRSWGVSETNDQNFPRRKTTTKQTNKAKQDTQTHTHTHTHVHTDKGVHGRSKHTASILIILIDPR